MPTTDPKVLKRFSPKGWWKQWREKQKDKQRQREEERCSVPSDIEASVQSVTMGARFLREVEICRPIALLDRGEVYTGRLLGEGSFCEAFEVTSFKPRDHEKIRSTDASASNTNCNDVDETIEACRQELWRTVKLDGRPRYALKQLSINLYLMQGDIKDAAIDLVVEANYLMRLDHPNIMKIRGMALGGPSAFDKRGFDGFFVVLDRLEGTLDERIHRWKKKKQCGETLFLKSTVARKAKDARQVASALAYLHRHRIIFRDCKPQNIGYKDEGGHYSVQLFDFGFCRELPDPDASSESLGDDEVFRMSKVGSPHYIAPELLLDQGAYNLKADVYSFAVTFYEMLTLKHMGERICKSDCPKKIAMLGKRPNLSKFDLPFCIKELLQKAWCQSITERASMQEVYNELGDIIQELAKPSTAEMEDVSEPASPFPQKKVTKSLCAKKKLNGIFRRSAASEETEQTSGFLSHTSKTSFNSDGLHL